MNKEEENENKKKTFINPRVVKELGMISRNKKGGARTAGKLGVQLGRAESHQD